MTSAFENLCGPGKPLRAEAPDAKEFAGLRDMGLAKLSDAQHQGLALASQFDLAYNAAHALCLAALRWHGYRSSNRYIVFQLLPHTLELGPEVWRVLAKCHEVRNRVRRHARRHGAPGQGPDRRMREGGREGHRPGSTSDVNASTLVEKLWNYCNVLRDGVGEDGRTSTETRCWPGCAAAVRVRRPSSGTAAT